MLFDQIPETYIYIYIMIGYYIFIMTNIYINIFPIEKKSIDLTETNRIWSTIIYNFCKRIIL